MTKKQYQEVAIEIIYFQDRDVITTSVQNEDLGGIQDDIYNIWP